MKHATEFGIKHGVFQRADTFSQSQNYFAHNSQLTQQLVEILLPYLQNIVMKTNKYSFENDTQKQLYEVDLLFRLAAAKPIMVLFLYYYNRDRDAFERKRFLNLDLLSNYHDDQTFMRQFNELLRTFPCRPESSELNLSSKFSKGGGYPNSKGLFTPSSQIFRADQVIAYFLALAEKTGFDYSRQVLDNYLLNLLTLLNLIANIRFAYITSARKLGLSDGNIDKHLRNMDKTGLNIEQLSDQLGRLREGLRKGVINKKKNSSSSDKKAIDITNNVQKLIYELDATVAPALEQKGKKTVYFKKIQPVHKSFDDFERLYSVNKNCFEKFFYYLLFCLTLYNIVDNRGEEDEENVLKIYGKLMDHEDFDGCNFNELITQFEQLPYNETLKVLSSLKEKKIMRLRGTFKLFNKSEEPFQSAVDNPNIQFDTAVLANDIYKYFASESNDKSFLPEGQDVYDFVIENLKTKGKKVPNTE